ISEGRGWGAALRPLQTLSADRARAGRGESWGAKGDAQNRAIRRRTLPARLPSLAGLARDARWHWPAFVGRARRALGAGELSLAAGAADLQPARRLAEHRGRRGAAQLPRRLRRADL